jgi:hypothetical protein
MSAVTLGKHRFLALPVPAMDRPAFSSAPNGEKGSASSVAALKARADQMPRLDLTSIPGLQIRFRLRTPILRAVERCQDPDHLQGGEAEKVDAPEQLVGEVYGLLLDVGIARVVLVDAKHAGAKDVALAGILEPVRNRKQPSNQGSNSPLTRRNAVANGSRPSGMTAA